MEEEAESRDGRDRGARRAAESKRREDPQRQRETETQRRRHRERWQTLGRAGRDTGSGRDREAREHPTKELMRTERWIQSQRQMEMMREKERPSPGQARGHRNRLTRTFSWRELHEKTATNRRRVTERARERNQEASKSRDSRQMRPFSFIHLSIHSFV